MFSWFTLKIVVHIHNGILLSHEKEHPWVSLKEVDEPRVCYTEWSKSERENQTWCINAYIWNLERWNWWTYLQGSSGDAEIGNKLEDTVGDGEGGMNWESSLETHTLPYVKWIASGSLLYDAGNSDLVPCDSLGRWEGGSRGRGHVYACGLLMLMYGRDQHNIVKQLSSN